MKVLYIIDSLEGYGAEKSLVQIAVNMKWVKPVFVHLYKGEKLKPYLYERGIRTYSLNIDSKYGYKKAIELISPIILKEQPRIIHSTLFRADMVARQLKTKFPDLPLVGSFVSNSYGKMRYLQLSAFSRLKLFVTQCKDRRTAGKVDFFICNSKAIKQTNIKALGIPEEKVKVIYRGRNFEDFNVSQEDVCTLRRDLHIGKRKVFLNVGRFHQGKGQTDLLDAFKKLNTIYPQTVLLIAGEGFLRQELEKSIEDYGLEEKVILLGYREDIAQILAVSDYFVFPSYFEGLPGALIEAIISRKPSIVSNIPENRECFVEDGALFFEPGNISEFTERLKEAVELEDWEERTARSLENAKSKFDIRKVSKEYELFYEQVLLNIK